MEDKKQQENIFGNLNQKVHPPGVLFDMPYTRTVGGGSKNAYLVCEGGVVYGKKRKK